MEAFQGGYSPENAAVVARAVQRTAWQSLLRYGHFEFETDFLAHQAEGLAFWRILEAAVAQVDPERAALITAAFTSSEPEPLSPSNYCYILAALEEDLVADPAFGSFEDAAGIDCGGEGELAATGDVVVDDDDDDDVQEQEEVASRLYLGEAWVMKLKVWIESCVEDILQQNADMVLELWHKHAGKSAQSDTCFFKGALMNDLEEWEALYGSAMSEKVKARAIAYVDALQRARIVDCIHLSHLLWPVIPWMGWLICKYYLGQGLFSAIYNVVKHSVTFSAIYMMAKFLHASSIIRFPEWMDLSYPILRKHPFMLALVMKAPSGVPWYTL